MNGVYLTIDTGTTNTRVTVLKDGALLAQAKKRDRRAGECHRRR